MLRHPSLIPLSHQHRHVLVLCVRIDRGLHEGGDIGPWRLELEQLFRQEIDLHFAAEEKLVFPLVAGSVELGGLVEELVVEHGLIRAKFNDIAALDAGGLRELAQQLANHIRREERQLFQGMQQTLSPETLVALGGEIQRELAALPGVCLVPDEATRR